MTDPSETCLRCGRVPDACTCAFFHYPFPVESVPPSEPSAEQPRPARFAPPCEVVIARFVFGGQTCDEPAVGRVRCPDDACGSRPHSHAVCGFHGGAS